MHNIGNITKEEFEKSFSLEMNTFAHDMIYILPEENNPEQCVLNEFSSECKNIAKEKSIPCEVIYNKNNYRYLVLRDSQIILPFIISYAANLCYDFFKTVICKRFKNVKNLKVRMFVINDYNNNSVKKIEIEGDAESVLKAVDLIKKEDLKK